MAMYNDYAFWTRRGPMHWSSVISRMQPAGRDGYTKQEWLEWHVAHTRSYAEHMPDGVRETFLQQHLVSLPGKYPVSTSAASTAIGGDASSASLFTRTSSLLPRSQFPSGDIS